MAPCFPEAGNLNGRNANMSSDVTRPLSNGLACLSFEIGQILRTFTIPPTFSTTGRHLGFERDRVMGS